jgi:hypothetical protein
MHLTTRRQAQYCRRCQCHAMFRWQEPKHHSYAALSLALLASNLITPLSGALMLAVWAQRIASTCRWACPHCSQPLQAA